MKYKHQHFVTEAYLRAWCDPKTPEGAFVWVVSKSDHKITRKSPKNLFVEDDFYTIYNPEGNRSVILEHELKKIEDKFIVLRDNKFKEYLALSPDDRKTIALFLSTLFVRTKRTKEEDIKIWQDYIVFIDSLPSNLSSQIKRTKDYREVKELHAHQPMPFHLVSFVNIAARYLYLMNCAIYTVDTNTNLITSDNPCLWIDPSLQDRTQPISFFGLSSPQLNIILPISPTQYLSLEKNGYDGYIDLRGKPDTEEIVDSLNSMTTHNADKFIVLNRNKLKDKWFE